MKHPFVKLSLATAVMTASTLAVSAQLEEVIVTAQKRAESLQDVPISVTAISGDLVEDASIRSFSELSAYVPNFSVTENAVNTIISMRGISIGSNQSFEQSVGVFVDGVHYGKSRQARLGLFDLEQIEVLRGPQGILFGKNTLAGAVNVRTAAPQVGEGLTGRLAASFESDNGKYFEGHIGTSLSDTLAIRLSGMNRTIDGYLDNSAPSALSSDAPTTDETIARIGVQWEPTANTSLGIRYTYSDFVREGAASTVTTFQPLPNVAGDILALVAYTTLPLAFPAFAPSQTDTFRDGVSFGGNALDGSSGAERGEGTDTQNHEFSVNFEHTFDSGLTFSSVTGMSNYEYKDGMDADFLPISFIGRSDDSEYDQVFQEFRLASDPSNRFSWTVGANYIESEQQIDRNVVLDGTLGQPGIIRGITAQAHQTAGLPSFFSYSPTQIAGVEALLGLPPGAIPYGVEGVTMWSQLSRLSTWTQDTESWAMFAQGSFDLTDTLSITAGLRYTEETKKVDARMDLTQGSTGLANPVAPEVNPLLHGLVDVLALGLAHEFKEERDTDQLMPAVSIDWRPADDHLFYVSYSEGFKSGGFNSVDDQRPAIAADGTVLRTVPDLGFEYDDETAWSMEIGGKHLFLDGSLRFNWNYFNSEYEDQQVSTFVGTGFVVANAAKSEVSGFEIDAAWQMTEKLRMNLSVGFLDGEYGSFPGAGCTAAQRDAVTGLGTVTADSPVTSVNVDGRECQVLFAGDGTAAGAAQDITGTQLGADYSGSFGLEFVQPIGSMAWFTQVDYNFTDDFPTTGDRDPRTVEAGFEKINLRTGLRGDNWMVMLYGRNITDELTSSGYFAIPLATGSIGSYRSRGEVWGIQAAFEF